MAHVVKSRNNYSNVIFTVNEIINVTRKTITDDILAKQDLVNSRIASVIPTANNLYKVMRDRRCSVRSINIFFDALFAKIQANIEANTGNAKSAYLQLGSSYVPVYLVYNLFERLRACLYLESGNGLQCLLKVWILFPTTVTENGSVRDDGSDPDRYAFLTFEPIFYIQDVPYD